MLCFLLGDLDASRVNFDVLATIGTLRFSNSNKDFYSNSFHFKKQYVHVQS